MVARDAQDHSARSVAPGTARGLANFLGESLGIARAWLETRFQSDVVRALSP
jgi:hypothetical protein